MIDFRRIDPVQGVVFGCLPSLPEDDLGWFIQPFLVPLAALLTIGDVRQGGSLPCSRWCDL